MDMLFHVSTATGGQLLLPLLLAADRAGCRVGIFFTHEGVLSLKDADLTAALGASERAVVCEESWHRFCPGVPCPVEAGSQTVNSALMGEASKVVSL
ncbi:MAG: hypothetical protein K9J74_03590 [Sulfuritalea sp.]|nr:hypothetical protein [Sulfuritalea sp.]